MVKRIVWTTEAASDLETIVNYLQEEWGDLSCQKFLNTVFAKLDKLLQMPSIARFTNQTGVQIFQLDRKNVVFFTVQDDQIVLLSIYPYKKDLTKSKYF